MTDEEKLIREVMNEPGLCFENMRDRYNAKVAAQKVGTLDDHGRTIAVYDRNGDRIIAHRRNIPWHAAPLPQVKHVCEGWTDEWHGLYQTQWCACGAERRGIDGPFAPWRGVNSSRSGRDEPQPDRTLPGWMTPLILAVLAVGMAAASDAATSTTAEWAFRIAAWVLAGMTGWFFRDWQTGRR
jgi:hypothetical protein